MNEKKKTPPSKESRTATKSVKFKASDCKAKVGFFTVAAVLCCVSGTAADLSWLGPRMESVDLEGTNMAEHSFLLNASSSELSRTDFEGEPKTLDRSDRHFVVNHIKNYLDHIGEVYSPPRITEAGQKQGLRGKIALDLTTGWDFCKADQRKKARALIDKHKPAVLILSPPCRFYSQLRNLSNFKRDPAVLQWEEQEATCHMDFAIELAENQVKTGRGFILEQPAKAASWKLAKMDKLLAMPYVYQIHLDMCRFELRAKRGPFAGQLVKKPTILATNIEELAAHVEKQCLKNHKHGVLLGGAAQEAAVYMPKFVDAIVKGIKESLGFKSKGNYLTTAPDGASLGRASGALAYDYAMEQVKLDEEMKLSFPVAMDDEDADSLLEAFPSEEPQRAEVHQDLENPLDVDAVEETRRQMRRIQDQPGISQAMEKVEDFEKHEAGAFSLAPNLRREVLRVHRQLGHPSQEIFLRALRHAGVRDDVIVWAKQHFQCPKCASRPRPTPARPGHLLRALEFNTVVGIDLCFLDIFNQQTILLVCYQQAQTCQNKSAEEIVKVFMSEWVKHYGPPVLLIMDRGKEFYNNHFQETIGGMGVGLHYIDAQSPWQNGRTEKAGGVLKEKILATVSETSASLEDRCDDCRGHQQQILLGFYAWSSMESGP